MKNDKLFRHSVIFADLILFAILCYTAVLGTATATGQYVIYAGILLTSAVFVALCKLNMDLAGHTTSKLVHA